jgi:hypothetical protein
MHFAMAQAMESSRCSGPKVCRYENWKVVHYLVGECGADILAVNNAGCSPLHMVSSRAMGRTARSVYLVGLLPYR